MGHPLELISYRIGCIRDMANQSCKEVLQMDWTDIKSMKDIDFLMEAVEHFHDWYLAGFAFDPLARADSDSLNLARFVIDVDSLIITLRYDSKDKLGRWPELEMRFDGVYAFRFFDVGYCDPYYECNLVESDKGWVFCNDEAPTSDELADPANIKSRLLVVSDAVSWRPNQSLLERTKA